MLSSKYIFIILWTFCWIILSECLIEIPLERHKSAKQMLMEQGQLKYIPKSSTIDDVVSLTKFSDMEFFAYVNVGHPGQKMKLVLDIGWRDSWMLSKFCPYTNLICLAHTLYDSKISSTYIPNGEPFLLQLGDGNMTGFLSADTITLGHSNVTNVTFVEITDVPPLFMFLKADGLLSFGTKQPGDKRQTFIEQMFQSGAITAPIFSIYINADKTSTKGGSLYLGGVHDRNFDNKTLIYLPSKSLSWTIQMSNFSMIFTKTKNTTFCKNGCDVQLDTGNACIYGPEKDINQLNMLLGARKFILDRYIIDCDAVAKLPKIFFNFRGVQYIFRGQDLIQEISVAKIGRACLSIFVKHDTQYNQWIFGTSFMKKVYTIYDFQKRQIGLASTFL